LQEVTESEIPKDVNMLCGIFPEGIADKAFPAGSPARIKILRYFYATVRFMDSIKKQDAILLLQPVRYGLKFSAF